MAGSGDLHTVHTGSALDVVMFTKIKKQYDKLSAKDRGRIGAIMQKYADDEELHETQFKFESREKVGDRKGTAVAVWAFKGWKKRVYGVRLTDKGRPKFVCSEIDIDKKQDKADAGCLKRAAENARELIEEGWTP